MRDADRGVRGVPDRGLGVEGDAQARRRDHVEVIRPVADRHRLAQRNPGLGGEVAQRPGLAGPVDDGAGDLAGEPPADDLQRVGRRVVQAEIGGENVGELGEAAAHDSAPVAEPPQRADQSAGAGSKAQLGADVIENRGVEPGEQCDPLTQRGGEVQLAAHRGGGQLGDLRRAPGTHREQVDGLAVDQRGVDVHHDQAHGAPVQAAALHRDVDALLGGLAGKGRAQRRRVGPGDVELDAGHRPVRQPGDPVDVRAAGGDPPGDGPDRGRGQLAAEHRDMQAAAAAGWLGRASCDLRVQAQVGRHRGHLTVDRGQVGGAAAGQQHAEHQAPPDHDLLDVEHAEFVRGEDGEQAGGDTRPVPAGHGYEQRHLWTGHRGAHATHGRPPGRPRAPNSCHR